MFLFRHVLGALPHVGSLLRLRLCSSTQPATGLSRRFSLSLHPDSDSGPGRRRHLARRRKFSSFDFPHLSVCGSLSASPGDILLLSGCPGGLSGRFCPGLRGLSGTCSATCFAWRSLSSSPAFSSVFLGSKRIGCSSEFRLSQRRSSQSPHLPLTLFIEQAPWVELWTPFSFSISRSLTGSGPVSHLGVATPPTIFKQ